MMKSNCYRGSLIVLGLLILGSFLPLRPLGAADEPAGRRCLSFQKDLTNSSAGEFLGRQALMPLGPTWSVMLRNGQKISRQTFAIAGQDKTNEAAVTITCTSTCTGNICGILGCDASQFGCTSCSCHGSSCSACSCTKTSTYTAQ
jgi:hypothetical protein